MVASDVCLKKNIKGVLRNIRGGRNASVWRIREHFTEATFEELKTV